jgi:23S rRNA (cytosine1962-C5)-methyltransferase
MNEHQLLDFGEGRKLERFGPYVLDRPSPAAEGVMPTRLALWPRANAVFSAASASRGGEADWDRDLPPWTARFGPLVLELRLTPFGHVGAFPEQADNWDWIGKRVEEGLRRRGAPLKVLNLFAYTGGATLAAAAAGAEVTHVDAARNTLGWARRNAELSGLAAAPIRWIADDARKFVARELRRGRRYDAVILDPPSYGHGAGGEAWKINEHLAPLLADCAELTQGESSFFLLTCHSPGYGAAELRQLLSRVIAAPPRQQIDARPLALLTPDGRRLPSGFSARWDG